MAHFCPGQPKRALRPAAQERTRHPLAGDVAGRQSGAHGPLVVPVRPDQARRGELRRRLQEEEGPAREDQHHGDLGRVEHPVGPVTGLLRHPVRAEDKAGNIQPDSVPFNEQAVPLLGGSRPPGDGGVGELGAHPAKARRGSQVDAAVTRKVYGQAEEAVRRRAEVEILRSAASASRSRRRCGGSPRHCASSRPSRVGIAHRFAEPRRKRWAVPTLPDYSYPSLAHSLRGDLSVEFASLIAGTI